LTPFALPETIPEGVRNDKLTRYAGLLRRDGLEADTILRELRAANAARCLPPLDDREVVTIARSIAKYPPHPVEVWHSPARDLAEVARRRGYRLLDRVRRDRGLQFTVEGRRGGGPYRVDLGSPTGASCTCVWRNDPRNETETCSHVEAARAFVRLRYRPLEVGLDTG